MKCPICGCTIKEGLMCPYCQVTEYQVKNASNKLAKQKIKEHDTKEVYNSTTLPKDVNATRLMLIALFGGLFGIHQYYVGRYKTGLIYTFSTFLTLIFFILSDVLYYGNTVLKTIADVFYFIEAIIVLLWMFDFFRALFKKFPIPVVLPKEKVAKK